MPLEAHIGVVGAEVEGGLVFGGRDHLDLLVRDLANGKRLVRLVRDESQA